MHKQFVCKQILKKKVLFFFSLSILLTLAIVGSILYVLQEQSDGGLWLAFIVAALLLLILIWGVLFFQRNIIIPLQELCSTIQRITDGDFDKPVQIRAVDEIGQVGECVNDLAINVQEILLYTWNHTHNNFIPLADLPLDPALLKKEISKIYQVNEDLKEFLRTFTYFEVKLEQDAMLSDTPDDSTADNA